jgi:hypothetical protein
MIEPRSEPPPPLQNPRSRAKPLKSLVLARGPVTPQSQVVPSPALAASVRPSGPKTTENIWFIGPVRGGPSDPSGTWGR